MLLFHHVLLLAQVALISAVAIVKPTQVVATASISTATTLEAIVTEAPDRLFKRKVIPSKTSTSLSLPSPWLRTISSTVVQMVTPTIVGGVTFSAKPKNVDTPLPWLSIQPNGFVKTIMPKVKDGITKNASPTYGNYFDIPVTSTISLGALFEEHKGTDKTHEEVNYIPDPNVADRRLNPIMRCTPDRYFKKKIIDTKVIQKPFCSPSHATNIIVGETHWITWYTRFFPNAKKVRLHMAYIEKGKNGHLKKRDELQEDAFFTTEWLDNLDGVYPLEITPDELLGAPMQNVILSIQPDYVDDEDHSLVNGTELVFRRYPLKQKKIKKLQLESQNNDSALYVALTIPTVIVVFVCGYAIVNYMLKDNRSWKKLKIKTRSKALNNGRYTALPTNTYELNRR